MGIKRSLKKIKRDNSASKNIERNLVVHLYEKRHSPITIHFNGCGLGECDVISISKSDYIYEYEVKISKSDFKADFKKKKHGLMLEGKSYNERYSKYYTPNYFFFVTPNGLITVEDVPDYAGLMYMHENGSFSIEKPAPIIHKCKATPELLRNIAHNLSCKLVFNKI